MKKRMITYNNIEYTVDEFCKEFVISKASFNCNYYHCTRTIEEMVNGRRLLKWKVHYKESVMPISEFCLYYGINTFAFVELLEHGFSLNQIMRNWDHNEKFRNKIIELKTPWEITYIDGNGNKVIETKKRNNYVIDNIDDIISLMNDNANDIITEEPVNKVYDISKNIIIKYKETEYSLKELEEEFDIEEEKILKLIENGDDIGKYIEKCDNSEKYDNSDELYESYKRNPELRYKGTDYYSIKDFCDEFGISLAMFRNKIMQFMSIDDILKIKRDPSDVVYFKNRYYSILELCHEFKLSINDVCKSLENGIGITEYMENAHTIDIENLHVDEEKVITVNTPIQITSPTELINNLRGNRVYVLTGSYGLDNINLIDYENICNDDKMIQEILKEENTINIFFFNSCIYSNKFFKTMRNINTACFYVTTSETNSQLIDHLIMYYAGAITSINPFNDDVYTTTLSIVSKDSHFYKIKKYISSPKILIKGMDYIEDKDDKFVISVAKYLINNRYINNNTAIKKDEFRIIFKNFFKLRNKQMNEDNLNNLIDRCTSLGFLTHHEETCTYSEYYSVNIVTVKQELRRLKKSRA